jgi:HAE1 family hydrophobic/amphiphilic exporter-1
LKENFASTFIPNQNFNMIPLSRVAKGEDIIGYSQINRQNKGRFIAITANLGKGGNLGDITTVIEKLIAGNLKPPLGVTTKFEGQAQDMKDLMQNMLIAMGLGVLFIYLVLASLYESFVTPFSILPALPLAISGAFGGILLAGVALDLFSMIGMILLLGVVAKNSILLVDYAKQLIEKGMPENEALIESGKTRLRPILMTTLALISGILPIAIGITPLGTQRQSMGVAIIGGLISSTLLTLVVVPAIYGYVERFRRWSLGFANRMVHGSDSEQKSVSL